MRTLAWALLPLLACACGPSTPSIEGGGATCHELADVGSCSPELVTLKGECSATHGPNNADPIVCEDGVKPDGNCKPLGRSVTCEGAAGAVFCCGEN